jgi:hypothetical protein
MIKHSQLTIDHTINKQPVNEGSLHETTWYVNKIWLSATAKVNVHCLTSRQDSYLQLFLFSQIHITRETQTQ